MGSGIVGVVKGPFQTPGKVGKNAKVPRKTKTNEPGYPMTNIGNIYNHQILC